MKTIVEGVAAILMVLALGGALYERIKCHKGIGIRVIQFLAVCFVIPALLILALEGKISTEVVGTLMGTVIGYTLSGIGKDEPSSS